MNRKKVFKAVLALAVAMAMILPGAIAFANDKDAENNDAVGIPVTQTNIASSVMSTKEKILPVQFTATSEQSLGVDFPVFSTGDSCQNPGVTTDGFGNILALTEEIAGPIATSIWGRWSTDSGDNWVDEESITGWQFTDAVEKPMIDYKEGMTAWGTLTPGPNADADADTYYIDFPDITDPTVPSPISPDGWTAWHVDWAVNGFSDFDSADVACYPYTPGKSPSTNFFGVVAVTGNNPLGQYTEDDTMLFSFMIASGNVQIVLFYNMDQDVEKIRCDIDQSLAQYYWVCEYTNESDIMDKGSLFIKAPVFDGTDEWWQGASGYPGFLFDDVYNPNIVASDGSVYIVGETAGNDIVCLYSSDAGVRLMFSPL